MLSKVKKISQKAINTIVTIRIVRIGMVIDQDSSVVVGWKRKKMVDNSEQFTLISKGRKEISEINIDHTF